MIFKFALNTSSTIRSFFTKSLEPITVFPHQALETSQIHGDTSHALIPIDSFLRILNNHKVKRFYMYRTYALGDILMLVPVIRALRHWGYDPYIRTTETWRSILELLDIETKVIGQGLHPADWSIMLDGTLEQDHFRPKLSEFHRVDIYFMALGAKKIPKKLDWSMDMEKLPEVKIPAEHYIVFQGRGTTHKKQLPRSTIQWLISKFEELEIPVVYIGEKIELEIKKKTTMMKWRNMSVRALFSYIAKARILITMDSSPLWISHFTQTPAMALLGPTRVGERMTKHPLYPDKAIGIALNEMIDCPSCFEASRKCNDKMDCLKVRPERIWEKIYPKVEKWL